MGSEGSNMVDALGEVPPVAAFLGRVFPQGGETSDPGLVVRERTFRPRRRSEAVSIRLPLDWHQQDNPDRNFRMQLQGWTMLHPVMDVFDKLDDKSAALEYFFDIVRDWWSNFEGDPEDIVTARTPESYTWYDMSVGFRALVLAFFAGRIAAHQISVSSDDSALLVQVMEKHRRHLRNDEVIYPNNHGIFQIHGLRGLASVSNDADTTVDADRATVLMEGMLTSQFDANGVHVEHSPHYHKFVLDTFVAVRSSGWYERSPLFEDRLELAERVLPWLLDPLQRPAAVGDSLPSRIAGVQTPRAEATGEVIASRFGSSGYAVVRSNWDVEADKASFLFMTGGYHSKSHKHRDCLSFEWTESSVKRVADSGKFGYWASPARRYMLSARAHNSVEIEGFDILRLSPYGSALQDPVQFDRGLWRIDGELDYPAVRHRRSVFFSPGRWVVVQDHVASARERDVTQWFHLGAGHERLPDPGHGRLQFRSPDGESLYLSQLVTSLDESVVFGSDPDTDKMQGFISERDDHIEPAFAVGYSASSIRGFYGAQVLALGAANLADAEIFASALEVDREFTVSSKPAARPLARSEVGNKPPMKPAEPRRGSWWPFRRGRATSARPNREGGSA